MAENIARSLAEGDIAKRLASLSPAQRALLESRLKKKGLTAPPQAGIPRRPTGEPATLSYAQERLWFLAQLDPKSTAYVRVIPIRLTGALCVEALQQSLTELVRRHEALRTAMPTVAGQPAPFIAPARPIPLPMFDLVDLAPAEREERVRQLAHQESQRPIELSQAPLFRATLLRLGLEEHVLILTTHHIVTDAWSDSIMWREIAALYGAFSRGQAAPLPEPPIQYADYAWAQRQWLQGDVLNGQVAYWRQQLSGAPALVLPTDRPRVAAQTERGGRYTVTLPANLSLAIQSLSRQEGATLFMTLFAAFNALLYRYSGQTDLSLGTPIAGRTNAETERLIGFFVNTLVMRTDLSGDPTFRELLGRVRQTTLGAYDHQDMPFAKLVQELNPQRNLGTNPLFQVMFNLWNVPPKVMQFPGLQTSEVEFDKEVAQFELSLDMAETPEGLLCVFEYFADLFDEATIVRMAEHFKTLLAGIVEHPDQQISALPLLTESERHQLLIEWNDTRVEYPQDVCIHRLFEAQVERTPDAIAVQFENQQLTYDDLNRRANQLAHYLQSLGLEPETLVGLCMERSPEMVIGVLGILKAGAAYVPLDPAYPQERLEYMLADSHAQVLITQQHLVDRFSQNDAYILCPQAERESIAQQRDDNPDSRVGPDNLVYVIYTSGSTGAPKGVMVQHGSLVNFAWYAGVEYALVPGDRVLQFAALSWDTSAEEIFPCLTRGATLVLRTDAMISSIRTFVRCCQDWAITMLTLPTVYWHELAAGLVAENLSLPPSVRMISMGGEMAHPERLALWQECVSRDVRLVNTFGLTEATAVSTLCDLTLKKFTFGQVPIGRPIANTWAYLLDSQLQLVPVGVPGTLYIGGKGVSRGYLNRAELTTARFISDPYRPGERLYNTGDLARWLQDGNIGYLGRADNQVKVRGYRIELGEIETALCRHPAVHNGVVVACEDVTGGKQLVAYVVPRTGAAPTLSDLRHFLKESLPEYMLPAALLTLDRLPLTPSGKVDRRALPAPDQAQTELAESFVAPRTPTEETLANLWAEVLGIKPVGIHDNFFELGGHSLVAARLMSRLYKAFEIDLPVGTLFEASTVASLAQHIDAIKWAAQSAPQLQVPAHNFRDEGEL